jgi:hypothetical protein
MNLTEGLLVSTLGRVSLAGFAALASAVSIVAAAPSATPAYAAEHSAGKVQNGYDCGNFFGTGPVCIHWWGPDMNAASDYAQVSLREGQTPRYALYSSDRNNDAFTIALQVDTTDGEDGPYYTRCDRLQDSSPEIWREDTIRRFRFVAVRIEGQECVIAGTPTEWHTPAELT